jgi:hypothetical protein
MKTFLLKATFCDHFSSDYYKNCLWAFGQIKYIYPSHKESFGIALALVMSIPLGGLVPPLTPGRFFFA